MVAIIRKLCMKIITGLIHAPRILNGIDLKVEFLVIQTIVFTQITARYSYLYNHEKH